MSLFSIIPNQTSILKFVFLKFISLFFIYSLFSIGAFADSRTIKNVTEVMCTVNPKSKECAKKKPLKPEAGTLTDCRTCLSGSPANDVENSNVKPNPESSKKTDPVSARLSTEDKDTNLRHLETFIDSPDEDLRIKAINHTDKIRPHKMVIFLRKFKNNISRVRSALVRQTGTLFESQVALKTRSNFLRGFIADPSPQVRVEVVRQMAFVDARVRNQILQEYSDDPSPMVKQEVVKHIRLALNSLDESNFDHDHLMRVLEKIKKGNTNREIK